MPGPRALLSAPRLPRPSFPRGQAASSDTPGPSALRGAAAAAGEGVFCSRPVAGVRNAAQPAAGASGLRSKDQSCETSGKPACSLLWHFNVLSGV